MAVIENVSTEIGDVMRITSDIPIVGIITLNSFVDDTEGEQIIDGDEITINSVNLSSDLSSKAVLLSNTITFNQTIKEDEIGLLSIQKDALILGQTYKLTFTVNQGTSKFFKLNLSHSNAKAVIQYSAISVGQDVSVLCLITPVVSDSESNKPLIISVSNLDVVDGETIEITNLVLNEVSTDSRYFQKEFRYSVDAGLNFTAWQDLNNVNVQAIVVSRRDQFVTEIKLTRTGLNATGELVFNSLNIGGIYNELPYKIYQKTFFAQFFTVNDVDVLNWSTNVLEKLYKTGITPWYIERDTGEEDVVEEQPTPNVYEITTSVTGGTVIPETVNVSEGGSTIIVFTPTAGFEFNAITINGVPTSNYNLSTNNVVTISLTNINEDKLVEVVFVETTVELPYGYLYNGYIIFDTRALSVDWRIPSDSDWLTLTNYLGGHTGAAAKLKSTRTQPLPHPSWTSPNTGAIDSYKFSALPGGLRSSNGGVFTNISTYGHFLCSSYQYNQTNNRLMSFNGGTVFVSPKYFNAGASIRLMRDLITGEELLSDGTFVDDYVGNDEKTYKAVKIGTQVWMAENLKETLFTNLESIPEVISDVDWVALNFSSARCEYPL